MLVFNFKQTLSMGTLRYGESTLVVSPIVSNIRLGADLLALTNALAYY